MILDILDNYTLIKLLKDIDHKLTHRTYFEENRILGQLSQQIIKLPSVRKCKYTVKEISCMYDEKIEIIFQLNKRGIISDEEYKKYILSEDGLFTPRLNFNQ